MPRTAPVAAADAPSGHNGTALDLTPVGVDTLIAFAARLARGNSVTGGFDRTGDGRACRGTPESPLAAAAEAALD